MKTKKREKEKKKVSQLGPHMALDKESWKCSSPDCRDAGFVNSGNEAEWEKVFN
jgi:hypothetical protein